MCVVYGVDVLRLGPLVLSECRVALDLVANALDSAARGFVAAECATCWPIFSEELYDMALFSAAALGFVSTAVRVSLAPLVTVSRDPEVA